MYFVSAVQVQYMHIRYCASLTAAINFVAKLAICLHFGLGIIAIFAIVFCFALISDTYMFGKINGCKIL